MAGASSDPYVVSLRYLSASFADAECPDPVYSCVLTRSEGRWLVESHPLPRALMEDMLPRGWNARAVLPQVGYVIEQRKHTTPEVIRGGTLLIRIVAGGNTGTPWIMTLSIHTAFKDTIGSMLPQVVMHTVCGLSQYSKRHACNYAGGDTNTYVFDTIMENLGIETS